MLTFVIVSSTVRKNSQRTIKSVVGGQERFDVLARCLLNLDRWKSRIGHDLNLIIFLSHPEEQKALNIPLKSLPNPLKSELDSVIHLIEIFSKPEQFNSRFTTMNFENLIGDFSNSSTIYYLTPDGVQIQEISKEFNQNKEMCFILGSQHDLSEIQENALQKIGVIPVSLGEKDYLASHVITIICHHFLS